MPDKQRCAWANKHPAEAKYHDSEWGIPVHNDRLLFEILTMESAQSGLSWLTILQKRDGYKKSFAKFDIKKVAKFSDKKIEKLVQNPDIVRHRLKIQSTVNNAQKILEVQKEFGSFDKYVWGFVNGKTIDHKIKNISDVPASNEISDIFSKDLKKRGFKFLGTTTCYAFMQAVGMVNDHEKSCFRYKK